MAAKQERQDLHPATIDGLSRGDADAGLDQQLVSAQNWVMTNRAAYNKALTHRVEVIQLAHKAGWSNQRIAKRLSLPLDAIEEALKQPLTRTALEFLDAQVASNGGFENSSITALKALVRP